MANVEQTRPATRVSAGLTPASPPRPDPLVGAAGLFTAAVLIHGADHARRGFAATGADVFWLGTSAILLEVAIVVLACQRHRLAPLVAAGSGFTLAFGYLFVHMLPARPWLSDSFTSATDVSPLSWFAASLEIAAALIIAVVGTVELHRRGGIASAKQPWPAQRRLAVALRHPIVITMIAGNVVLIVISATQF